MARRFRYRTLPTAQLVWSFHALAKPDAQLDGLDGPDAFNGFKLIETGRLELA